MKEVPEWIRYIGFGGLVVIFSRIKEIYNWFKGLPKDAIDVKKVEQDIDSQQVEDEIKQAKADQDIKDAQNEIIINNQKMAIELIVVLRAELTRAIDNITRLENELSREKTHCIGIQDKLNIYIAKYGIIEP